mmetsp:Transcript_30043/g.52750  ORF Transcript_30043/g.52750 Transcript_30043/m.52750 type:complete len:229 (-) Transcript_30043:88-774(-)
MGGCLGGFASKNQDSDQEIEIEIKSKRTPPKKSILRISKSTYSKPVSVLDKTPVKETPLVDPQNTTQERLPVSSFQLEAAPCNIAPSRVRSLKLRKTRSQEPSSEMCRPQRNTRVFFDQGQSVNQSKTIIPTPSASIGGYSIQSKDSSKSWSKRVSFSEQINNKHKRTASDISDLRKMFLKPSPNSQHHHHARKPPHPRDLSVDEIKMSAVTVAAAHSQRHNMRYASV